MVIHCLNGIKKMNNPLLNILNELKKVNNDDRINLQSDLLHILIHGDEELGISKTAINNDKYNFKIGELVYATGDIYAYDALLYPPPLNTKINIISGGFVQRVGAFNPNYDLAWFPLLKIPLTVKERMRIKSEKELGLKNGQSVWKI